VGIDIAKRKHVAFTLDGEGEPLGKALGISNDRDGFDKLLAHLDQLETKVIAEGAFRTEELILSVYLRMNMDGALLSWSDNKPDVIDLMAGCVARRFVVNPVVKRHPVISDL